MTDEATPTAETPAEVKLEAWQTEDGDAVVWGTHDTVEGFRLYDEHVQSLNLGHTGEEHQATLGTPQQWADAKYYWADPELRDDDNWNDASRYTNDMDVAIANPDWVPYMVVSIFG